MRHIKKGDRSLPKTYRPISLTYVFCKVMEHVLYHSIMERLDKNNILDNPQHGFRAKYLCESQLIKTVDFLARSLDSNKQTYVLILDFSKAFVTVPHQRLLHILKHCGKQGKTWQWISAWLTNSTQRVVVYGDASHKIQIFSGVPQGTVLAPYVSIVNKLH